MGDTYGFIRLEGCEVRRLTDGFGDKRNFVFEIYLPAKRSIYTFKSASPAPSRIFLRLCVCVCAVFFITGFCSMP